MASVPVEVRLSYAVPSRCGDGAFVGAFHDRRGSYQAPRIAGGSSGSITPRRHVPAAVSARVGLHLKPGQKGTKHLVVAESDWEPRFAPDEIVALRVAFTDVATRNRVKQAGGAWNPDRTVWQLRYDRVAALGLRRRIVTLRHPGLDAAGASAKHPDADAGPAST
jgi:hypothetical protein